MRRNDVIQISCDAYQVFYKKLNDKFYEEYFKDTGVKNTSYIWMEIDPNTKKPYAEKFLEYSNIIDTYYFLRKHIDYHPSKSQYGLINAQVFLNGLLYLGIQPVEIADKFDKMNKYDKAECLYNSFLELYSKEISDT